MYPGVTISRTSSVSGFWSPSGGNWTLQRDEPGVVVKYIEKYIRVPGKVITEVKVVEKPIYIEKEVPIMFTWTNILIIMDICFVAIRLNRFVNWRTAIRAFVKLIYKPARKEGRTIKAEWEEATKD